MNTNKSIRLILLATSGFVLTSKDHDDHEIDKFELHDKAEKVLAKFGGRPKPFFQKLPFTTKLHTTSYGR